MAARCYQFGRWYILVLLAFATLLINVKAELAIIHATGPRSTVDACALYNPHFGRIPQQLEKTPAYLAYMPAMKDGCSNYRDLSKFWNATSFVYAGNCTNYQKLMKAQQAGAKQVIVIGKSSSDYPSGTKDQFNYIHIPVGMVLESSWETLQSMGSPLVIQLWHPHDPLFDPNLLIIWLLAVTSVVFGSYWSGVTTIDRLSKEGDTLAPDNLEEDEDSLKITPLTILLFLGVICTTLLLLYFFYKYLIYVVIVLFSIAACNGTFDCMSAILNQFQFCTCKTSPIPYFKVKLEYRMIALFSVCLGIVIWWIIARHATYAWVLQDFLGVCFCISLIKLVKLPNLKVSALLLMALLIYDIFFVFITPLFSARGRSVMVDVATGRGNKEQLPMVIRVPKLIKSALSLCERPYSLLGFGDILLPGLFIGFCRNFDIVAGIKRSVYFCASVIGYGVGLFITFVALVYMKTGQPALLYLVPSVLLPVTMISFCRREFKSIWHGRVRTEVENEDTEHAQVNPEKDVEAKGDTSPGTAERRPLLLPDNHDG